MMKMIILRTSTARGYQKMMCEKSWVRLSKGDSHMIVPVGTHIHVTVTAVNILRS